MRVALSMAVLVVAATGANAAELLSNNTLDSPITVLSYDPAPAPALSTLTPGTWYTASKGWDQSWSIQTNVLNNNYLQYGAPKNSYDEEVIQFIPLPAVGTGYTYSYDYRSAVRPQWGFGASVRLLPSDATIYPSFFGEIAPGVTGVVSELGIGTEVFNADDNWYTNSYTFDITAEQAAAYSYLMVIFWGAGPGDLRIDNVSLTGAAIPALHPGDANGDGRVDVGDLGILGFNYGTATGATWPMADFNFDGAVDVGDLAILGANWGWPDPPIIVYGTTPVPEPATMSLLALGVLGLIRRRR